MLDLFLQFAALFFDLAGLAFVIGAGLIMLHQATPSPFKKTKKKKAQENKAYHLHRRVFVHRIVLGLDFFIVADLVKIAFVSSYESLMQILFIVIIRTILSYFLLKETDYK